MSRLGHRVKRMLRGLAFPILLLTIAQIALAATTVKSDSIAAPEAILWAGLAALIDGSLLRATLDTLAAAFAGLGIGGGAGLLLGIVLGVWRIADRLLEFTIEAIRPIPPVALIPLTLLIFGFGARMEIAVVAFATVWPVMILTRAAVAGIEPQYLEVARALRLGFWARVGKIVLPAALPRLFVALRLAAGIALIVAVTVEISVNPTGLGYAMMMAGQGLQPDLMLALLVWIGLVGWALNLALLTAQRKLFGPAAMVEVPR